MRPAAALLVLTLAAPAAAQAPAPPIEVKYTQFTLPNGLHVILHEDHSVPIATVNTWYHVGSANEMQGRTGFAHLFEHLMFMGSGHAPYGEFDSQLETVGGGINASTANDRTNYYIDVPSNALELALFLESDRMGYLLDAMNPKTVDAQREVVKNERRQSYENRPYGMADIMLNEMLYPESHPYHWPVIGYMPDLTAASYEDVVAFFKTYYTPSNASLVVAGDIDPKEARRLVEKWFADVPKGTRVEPIAAPPAALSEEKRLTLEDRVQLPRLYMAWVTPAHLQPGDEALVEHAHDDADVGPLVAPVSLADWINGTAALPPQLFSHSDQTLHWQTSIPDQPPQTGWGGRVADMLRALNGTAVEVKERSGGVRVEV